MSVRSGIPMFSDELALDQLPKTFTDAIQITRALGIPYIWIDALCIVQDDSEEWQAVAAKMDSVYLGSQLTIAAAQAGNSSFGCLNSDPLLDGVHHHEDDMFFRTPSLPGTDEQLLVRVYTADPRSRIQKTPLGDRGWTLQEHLLSHRTAFCMRPEVYWGCQASYQSQCGLHLTSDEIARGETTLPLMRRSNTATPLTSSDWHRVCAMYSRRDLTFPRDRIPAIAGITRYFAERMERRPIVGLWEETFSRDLAWVRASRHIMPKFSSLTDSVPSWSWLACPSSVYYPLDLDSAGGRVEHVKLVEWDVKWEGKPYASNVASAYVRVDGPVCEIPIRLGGTSFGSHLQIFGDEVETGTGEPRSLVRRCSGNLDRLNAGEIEPRAFPCLLISSKMGSREDGGVYSDEMFLILDSVDGGGKYRRVGLGWITGAGERMFDSSKNMSLVLV